MDKLTKPKDKPQFTLREARNLRVMSARELAEKSGVSAPSIIRIENGAVPRYATMRKLSEALGVRPDEIIWPGDPLGLNDLPGLKEPSEDE